MKCIVNNKGLVKKENEMRNLSVVFALTICIFLFPGISFSDDWHISIVDSVGDTGYLSSITLDDNNYPQISYQNRSDLDLRFAHWDGSSWLNEIVDASGDNGWWSSIAMNNQGYSCISYYDHTNGNLKYAEWIGTAWNIQIVDSSGDVGECTSIALDNQYYAHISYYDRTNQNLKYAQWTGSSWNKQTIDSTGAVGKYTSLELDSQYYPHITYYDETNKDLKYTHWTGSSWQIQTVDSTGDIGWYNSLALDSSYYPCISYFDATNGNIKYAHWTGSSWSISIIDSPGITSTEFSSIDIDNQDKPHISYSDNGDLKYAYWTGSSWQIQTVDSAANVGWTNSIVVDANGNPYISYYDATNDDLKIAWFGPNLGINLLSFTATQQSNNVSLHWSVETTQGEQIAGFNLYRRDINNVNDIAAEVANLGCIWTKVNPALITGQNPYAYTDGVVVGGLTYEYKLEAVLADESAETLGTTQATTAQPTTFAIVSLYPNPSSETMTCLLSVPNAGLVKLELYDLSGRMVLEKQINVNEPNEMSAVLDVSTLASGVYTLQASCGGAEASARCVVAR